MVSIPGFLVRQCNICVELNFEIAVQAWNTISQYQKYNKKLHHWPINLILTSDNRVGVNLIAQTQRGTFC